MHVCSTVIMFKYVCQTLRAAIGASNPKRMNEMHQAQYLIMHVWFVIH